MPVYTVEIVLSNSEATELTAYLGMDPQTYLNQIVVDIRNNLSQAAQKSFENLLIEKYRTGDQLRQDAIKAAILKGSDRR